MTLFFDLRTSLIKTIKLHGEKQSADFDAVEPFLIKMAEIQKEYSLDQIYNADESGLVFKNFEKKSSNLIPDNRLLTVKLKDRSGSSFLIYIRRTIFAQITVLKESSGFYSSKSILIEMYR
ncbi:hypothetical protein BpHYR1_022739 [Brachionus plicatilis]|uniref:Uncharacterized protein n=1 Tax=Brachionus plicatilis TaxID=10195 RepID=A0A3M7PM88_BRAPC|nr:hypothetical protein BpHYR1_022739 [Brachionus plicatilis]